MSRGLVEDAPPDSDDDIVTAFPITDYIEPEDCPLYALLPAAALDVLDDLLVTRAWTDVQGGDFVLGADFWLAGLPELKVPGMPQMSLRFGKGAGRGVLRIGATASLTLENVEITLTIDPHLLNRRGGSQGAEIELSGDILLDEQGLTFLRFEKADLETCQVAGTELLLEVDGLRIGAADRLFSLDGARITIPGEWGASKDGKPLTITGHEVSWSGYGLSGTFAIDGEGIEARLFDLDVTISEALIALSDGALTEAHLTGEVSLTHFAAESSSDRLLADFHIGPEGVSAALRGDSSSSVATISVKGLLSLEVAAVRLDAPRRNGGVTPPAILWLSGALTPLIEGDWPSFAFDEIGLDAAGGLHFAAGAAVATTAAFSVDWSFVQLTVTAFALSRPRDAENDIELRITAAVQLVDGLPAAASVDGLVARWRSATGTVDLSLDGLGLTFGVPGAFTAEAEFSFGKGGFKGHGALTIDSLDLSLDILADVHPSKDRSYNTAFLTMDTHLVPGGIPIGATGVSLYGVSGLLAINRELDTDDTPVGDKPDPHRFFTLYDEDSPALERLRGFASPKKWRDASNVSALGLGVAIGTSDMGWTFSARGALLLTLPDLSLLLTATAEIVSTRKGLESSGDGSIAALLAILPGEGLIRADLRATLAQPPLYQITGLGGAIFYFEEPTRFRVWAGLPPEEGATVSASLLDVNDSWWLTAGAWFGLDASRQLKFGAYAPLALRAEVGGVYAEVSGVARADLTTAWSPLEMFGRLDISGNACLAAGSLKLRFGLDAHVAVELAAPTDIRLGLRACYELDLGIASIEICFGFMFGFGSRTLPDVPAVPFDLAFAPRQWMPDSTSTGSSDGVVSHRAMLPGATPDLGTVQPHSAMSLAFPGAMTIDPGVRPLINAGAIIDPLPEAVSGQSRLLRSRLLQRLELTDLSAPGVPIPLSANVLTPPTDRPGVIGPLNQYLELWSTRRFRDAGSTGGGGAEKTPRIDCTPRGIWTDHDVRLAGLSSGTGGRLDNGWLYDWSLRQPGRRQSRLATEIFPGDRLTIWPAHSLHDARLYWTADPGDSEDTGHWPLSAKHLQAEPDGSYLLDNDLIRRDGSALLVKLAWRELVPAGGAQPHGDTHPGTPGGTLPLAAEDRILLPGHTYALTVQTGGDLLDAGNAVLRTAPSSASVARFTAAHAPLHPQALSKAVVGVYPADGARPVFLSYDLIVRFAEDWTEALYRLDGRPLAVRLIDSDGRPVRAADGTEAHLPTGWERAPASVNGVERWWRDQRAGTPCEATAPPKDSVTVLPISLSSLGLRPFTRYTAEVVAPPAAGQRDEGTGANRQDSALASWSFTTSAFSDFAALARPPATAPLPRSLLQLTIPTDRSFDALMRSFEGASVALSDVTRITPVARGANLAYLLVEAPEPLDDSLGRLSIAVAGMTVSGVVPNLDRTRLVVMLAPVPIARLKRSLDVTLHWAGAPLDALPEQRRCREGIADVAAVGWTVSLEDLQ